MSDTQEEKNVFYVRASPSRKRHGGIWRGGMFITLKFHKLNLTDEQHDLFASDSKVEVYTALPEGTSEDDMAPETLISRRQFSKTPTMVESLINTQRDDDEDEDEEPVKKQKKSKKKGGIEDRLGKQPAKPEAPNSIEGESVIPEGFAHREALIANDVDFIEQIEALKGHDGLEGIGDVYWSEIQKDVEKFRSGGFDKTPETSTDDKSVEDLIS